MTEQRVIALEARLHDERENNEQSGQGHHPFVTSFDQVRLIVSTDTDDQYEDESSHEE